MRLMTSNGLAAKRREKPPSSDTNRVCPTSTRGRCPTQAASVRPLPRPMTGSVPLLAGEPQVAGADHAERAQRQRLVVDVGRHLAEGEPVGAAELLFELDAAGDLAVDEDPHHALAARAGDEAVRLDVGHAEPRRDLALRQPADVVQPGGPRRQAGVVLGEEWRFRGAHHGVLPCKIILVV